MLNRTTCIEINGAKYSRVDQAKFFRFFSANFTWSILEYFVPNETKLNTIFREVFSILSNIDDEVFYKNN